ncbi:AMP-binding protein [Paralimibaculum aggregatum]|uniref:AMP-binding protein n=1 Tax=Paralimibaculum aggregatum TaxID=3036245 RepID=A0ABQ6LQP3_9RHOB|nr:class I adenylate-forming enzyme family protein [Limibaculum sp. NKW23]GMG83483.1 AMP-binding protein [Limibaculum sp. NKW23]
MCLPDPALSLFDAGPPEPCPARFNLAAHALAAARGPRAGEIALSVVGAEGPPERWSHADLEARVLALAGGLLAAGLGRGDRVLLAIGNRVEFPLLFLATVAAGGVAVPVSTQLTPHELEPLAEAVGPRFAVHEGAAPPLPEGAEAIPLDRLDVRLAGPPAEFADTGAEDPAFLIFTSGTGGRAKGVLHAQRSAWARRMMWQGWYGLEPGDRVLHAGAFNWTYTLGAGLIDPWAAGASTVIHTGPRDAGIWPRLAAAENATIFAAVPGVYRQMLRAGGALHASFAGLRHGLTAGEKMPEALAAAWTEATGKPLYEALGMSEISTYVSSSPAVAPRAGTAGRPQQGRRVAVVDAAGAPAAVGAEGMLAVSRRDPGLMLGYWQDAAGTAAAMAGEWFLTGDRARMDADGYVTHLGRADEVMTALGYRVSPLEVEAAMEAHPGVAEIAVAELPVRADLALIAGFVVPRGGWPGEAALTDWAAGRLAGYKIPKLWIEVPALPRTPNGKVIRRSLVAAHRRDTG